MNDNIENNNLTEDSPNPIIKILITIVSLLIVLSIGGFVWMLSQGSSLFNLTNKPTTDIAYDYDTIAQEGSKTDNAVGEEQNDFKEIYLTLTPKSTGSTNGYVYDLKTNKLRPVVDSANIDTYLSIFHSFDISGTSSTYLTSSKDNLSKPFKLLFRKGSGRTETVAQLPRPILGSAVISNNLNKILYVTNSDSVNSKSIPNAGDSDIILATKKNGTWSSKRLWGGLSPQWLSDGLFYYLKDGGIYLGILGKGIEDHVHKTTGVLGGNSRLALSNDTKYLAWSLPDVGKVIIFSNTYDKELNMYMLEKLHTIQSSAFWLSFSPDSTKIVMQAVDWDSLEVDPNPRMEMYSISTGKKITKDLNLTDYIQTAMFLTDWR